MFPLGLQRVRHVRVCVARRGDDPDQQGVAHLDDVTITDRDTLVGHFIGRVDVVRRTGHLGQGQTAGDVVVVDVSLKNVSYPHAGGLSQPKHPVDVTLRVDHQGNLTVMDEVAAVPQGRGLDRDDGNHAHSVSRRGTEQNRYP